MVKKRKVALITGVTGQDGSLLADFLLKKKYKVIGVKRRSSTFNTSRIDHLYKDIQESKNFIPYYGDMTDSTNIIRIIKNTQPDEIYNLAAQSHVHTSFETPEYTANADALGTLRILEAIKILNLTKKVKFYQASTSEMYGSSPPPQNENTPMHPASPYGAAKLYAHWITKNYRTSYNIFASTGILFNHEGPSRGETFVSRKITMGIANILKGKQKLIYLGNLDAYRDWGDARDYVEAMWKILQLKKPDDFVIATNTHYSVRDFVEAVGKELNLNIIWKGKGTKEIGVDKRTNKTVIKIDPYYFRPNDVQSLLGDASKLYKSIKWKPKTSFKKLVKIMVQKEIELIKDKTNRVPGLTVILIGDYAPSQIYVRNKEKNSKEVGINSSIIKYSKDVTEEEVLKKIKALNSDKDVSGILVQLPLPDQIDKEKIINSIDPSKDVDGFNPINVGNLASGYNAIVPCTPLGCLLLLKKIEKNLSGKHAVIIGRSNLNGKPMAQLLLKENCTVVITHSKTKNLKEECSKADILIAAVGVANLVKKDWVKDGSIIIDVGINKQGDNIVGDVSFEEVKDKVKAITPVPGGVGPMTIACLLKNTLECFKARLT